VTNKFIAKDGTPYDFEDGLKVGNVLLSGTSGGALIGFTPPAGMTAGTVQSAVQQLKDSASTGGNTSTALLGTPTAPTAAPGNVTTQIATTAFATAGLSGVSITPTVSSVAVSSITASSALLTANVTNTKGYNMASVTAQFQTALQSNPTAFTNRGSAVAFTSLATNFTTTASGLTNNTAYIARIVLLDSNNSTLSVTSANASFSTLVLANDNDSSFDIVGASYTTTNVTATNATISNTSNTATATADVAFATTVEMAQQGGQGNFTGITPVISFKPAKLSINAATSTSNLVINSSGVTLATGNQLYTVESGTLVKRTPTSISSSSALLNKYSSQNVIKASTVNDITGWTTGSSIPAATVGARVLVTNSRVYSLGGTISGSSSLATIYATVNNDSTLGGWNAGTNLPSVITGGAVIVTNSRVYYLGGTVSSLPSTTVFTAPIDSLGAIGTWTTGTALSVAVENNQAALIGNRVYVFGGATTAVQYAIIAADGTLGAWTAGTALPVALSIGQSIVTNSRLYLLTGTNTTATYYAPINADSSLGTWVAGTTLPAITNQAQVVMTKDRAFILGGFTSLSVYTAAIDANGIVGAWGTGVALPITISQSQVVVTATRVYLLGGNQNGTASSTVYYGSFADGWVGVNDTTSVGKSYLNKYSVQNIAKPTTVNNITGWVADTALPVTISYSQALVTSSRVYLLGGTSNGSVTTAVYVSIINSDGTLGAWSLGTALAAAAEESSLAVTANRVYLIGSVNANTVQSAPINSDGTLGAWVIGTALPVTSFSRGGTFVTNSRVYIASGYVNSSISAAIYYAPINADGTLGTWVLGTPFPDTFIYGSFAVTSSRVYLTGGAQTANNLNGYYAPINIDGNIGAWVLGNNLPTSASGGAQTVITASRIFYYVSTGQWTAPIDNNGVIGTWSVGSALAASQSQNLSQVVVTNSRIYMLGGSSSSAVFSAPFADGWNGLNTPVQGKYNCTMSPAMGAVPTLAYKAGQYSQSSLHLVGVKYLNRYSSQNVNKVTTVNDITGWTTGTSLPATVYVSQAIVTNSRVYLLGGYVSSTPSAVVYTAPINSDGTLGTWTTGTSLPATVAYSQSIVTNSRVYMLGGTINSADSAVVYTAPINSDGTLGTWTTGTSLPATVTNSHAIVTNSRVYMLGGIVSGTPSAVVYTAPINSDGTLGTWTTGTSLPATVYQSQAIVTNSRVYLLGGNVSSTPSAVVYTAPINSDGTLGTWTTGTSLPATVTNSHAIVTNSRVYMLGGIVAGSTSAVVYTAPINADGTLGTWTTGTSLPATFYQSQAIVTNSRVYLLGGSASAVVYTAPFADGWNGLNNNSISSANFITDTIATETLSSDQITMTCNTRLGDGRYVQTQIGMNNQDVSTELKATITF
jgi:hypothetical protein